MFKAFWSPFTNYLCLAFMALLLVLLYISGETIAVGLVPVWLVINWIGYQIKKCRSGSDEDQVATN